MRHSHERLLAANGISVGKAIPVKGINAILAFDQSANPLLLLRGKVSGPSWPSIADHLDQSGIEYSLIDAGIIWIVTADTSATHSMLELLTKRARQSAQEQVLVPDVGFVSAGRKKRFEPRLVIGPVVLAVVSLALALVPAVQPESTAIPVAEIPEATCALDLVDAELERWIASSIESSSSREVLVQSRLGLLRLEIEQTLGSTQSVTGSIKCEDGRFKSLHFRLDASASGALVELGQELDP
jgi:hypothetical protein